MGDAVATPVWFVESHGTLYIGTDAVAGKVKRIRHSGFVTLAPCTAGGKVVGPHVEGQVSIVSDPEEIARAQAALARKYGMQFRLIAFSLVIARFLRRRTAVLQMHTHQWVATFGNPGNGQYREELRRAKVAIQTYVKAHGFPEERTLLRASRPIWLWGGGL